MPRSSVVVSPPKAGGSASFQLAGQIVDVGSLNHSGKIIDEGHAAAVLRLVLNCPVDLRDVERQKNR